MMDQTLSSKLSESKQKSDQGRKNKGINRVAIQARGLWQIYSSEFNMTKNTVKLNMQIGLAPISKCVLRTCVDLTCWLNFVLVLLLTLRICLLLLS